MSPDEINVFEKVWKLIWELIYKIANAFGWDIADPYAPTEGTEVAD
ncbi:MAG: hypothetical protein ACI4GY_00235 [Acutalibacteraceae bacterium]